jgi:hypothetical protein
MNIAWRHSPDPQPFFGDLHCISAIPDSDLAFRRFSDVFNTIADNHVQNIPAATWT